MKKLFTLLAFVITITTFAQAPQGFNYQATVRNSSGALIINQNVNFRFNIMLNSQTSVPVYAETHYVLTDDLGQVNLTIGSGTATSGTFSTINWGTGNYYLGIELNTGNGYIAMGTSQLLSVPYALYANSAGNTASNLPIGTNIGDQLHWVWNGTTWVPSTISSEPNLPVIATNIVTTDFDVNIVSGTYYRKSGATISSDGGYSITSKGVCWSVNPNPTIADSVTNDGTGASAFTSVLSNLLPNTNYYYRAYATNLAGTAYGISFTFTTGAVLPIVQSTNLEVTTYRDGTLIPQVTDPTEWENLNTGAWCYYNNDTANGAIYGKLYNRYAVAGIFDEASLNDTTLRKNLAPTGWHVPEFIEFNNIFNLLSTGNLFGAYAGLKMKETGTTHWTSQNIGATNSSGFTGLPGGYRDAYGAFSGIHNIGNWWSLDPAVSFNLTSYDNNILFNYTTSYSQIGLSVRLVKD